MPAACRCRAARRCAGPPARRSWCAADRPRRARPPLRFARRTAAHQMQVGDRRVVAPDDVQRRVLGELRRAAGHGAIGPGPGLAAHAAAQRAAIHHGSRPACGRTATTCCRPTACRADRHSSAAPPPEDPSGRSPRWCGRGSRPAPLAQEMRSNFPAPFGPVRRNGCSRRRGPCTKAAMSCATLLQITPSVNGIALGAAHFHDALRLDGDSQAAGVRAVEGADAGAFLDVHVHSPDGGSRHRAGAKACHPRLLRAQAAAGRSRPARAAPSRRQIGLAPQGRSAEAGSDQFHADSTIPGQSWIGWSQ